MIEPIDPAHLAAGDRPIDELLGRAHASLESELAAHRAERESPYRAAGADHRLLPDPSLPVGEAVEYQTVAITSLPPADGPTEELDGPLDLLLDDLPRLASAPAEGVILTHQQGWRLRGVTLGRLLHSLALAPGEVTQIAVTGWQRRSRGQTSEDVDEQEQAEQDAGRQRSISEVTQGVASESTFGLANASSTAAQGDVGGSFLGYSGSSSQNAAAASTTQFSLGARSAAADSSQQVRQATQQHAASARRRQASVVQEVGTSDTEQFQTRVVANYNHQHAMNMLYFEVLQVFELSTRVVDAERCIFLPMQPMEFTADEVVLFARPLTLVAQARGDVALAEGLRSIDRRATAGDDGATELDGTMQREDVLRRIRSQALAYNQGLWLQMDPEQVRLLVDGRYADDEPLLTTIDPRPVIVSGTMIGFRWIFGPDRAEAAAAFRRRHVDESDEPTPRELVVLPTAGVFAEAVPGAANAAEQIDLTRHWEWDDTTIPILPTAIADLHQQRRERLQELRARELGQSAALLGSLPQAPPPPAHDLSAVIATSMFRDLSGQDLLLPLVQTAQQAAQQGSAGAQEAAHESISAVLDHLEELAPAAIELLKSRRGKRAAGGKGSGLNPTEIGGLKNALQGPADGAEAAAGEAGGSAGMAGEAAAGEALAGEAAGGLDVGALLSEAAELGLLL